MFIITVFVIALLSIGCNAQDPNCYNGDFGPTLKTLPYRCDGEEIIFCDGRPSARCPDVHAIGLGTGDVCYPNQVPQYFKCGPPPQCTSVGNSPLYFGSGCKSYVNCTLEQNTNKIISSGIYNCPGTMNFNLHSRNCEENFVCGTIPTPTTTGATTKTVATTTPATTTAATTTTTLGTCTNKLAKVAVPDNCRQYKKCSLLGQWKIETCPFNMKFNDATKLCGLSILVNCGNRP